MIHVCSRCGTAHACRPDKKRGRPPLDDSTICAIRNLVLTQGWSIDAAAKHLKLGWCTVEKYAGPGA